MKGYCVIGLAKGHEKILTKLRFKALHAVEFTAPAEYNGTEKDLAKLCLSEQKSNKLLTKIKDSEFARLFEKIYIRQIEITEEKIINIV